MDFVKKLEWLAGKLGYKTVWRFGLETLAVLFGIWALTVLLSSGWQSNSLCEMGRAQLNIIGGCLENGTVPVLVAYCKDKGEASGVDLTRNYSSYWYEQPNGTQINLPNNSLIGGLIK